MKLFEIIQSIETCEEDGTIFAQRIDGSYHPTSEAIVIVMTDVELLMKTSEVANERCPGKSYFLEVSIAQEFIEDWSANHDGKKPSNEQACKYLIHYSEYDSYPVSFFS